MTEQEPDHQEAIQRAREFRDSATRIRELWRQTLTDEESASERLLALISSLAISGATFGYSGITQQAARLSLSLQLEKEREFAGDLRPLDAGIDRLEAELLRASQRTGNSGPSAPRLFQSATRTVYIFDDDELHAEWIAGLLVKENYHVTFFSRTVDLVESCQDQPPRVLLLSLNAPVEGFEKALPMGRLRESMPETTVICLSDQQSYLDRIQSVRLGMDYYLSKPLEIQALMSLLEDEMDPDATLMRWRALCLSQNPGPIAELMGQMQSYGMQVRMLDNLSVFNQVVAEYHPDVILVHGDFDECSALEVAATMRQQVEYANLPLVVLIPEAAPSLDWVQQLNGDTVLQLPLSLSELHNHLRSQIQRSRRVSQYVNHLLREIRHREFHDALTGLPNRNLLDQRLEVEIRNVQYGVRRRLGLILLDIDNFQYVNDAYGHEAGDRLILDLAKRLASFLPERAFVARQGGDEFAILLTALREPGALEKSLRRLMRVCEAPFSLLGDDIRIGISVGATEYTKDLGKVSDKLLFKQADTALYRAKSAGRNGYALFEASMEDLLKKQVMLLSDLRQALEQEQLFLVYQPQLDLANGELVGAEVLLRWNHPVRGMISPAEFIPLAEAHGLIGELGNYVMKTAIRQVADWQRRLGRSVRLAVNVSPRQFSEPNFVRQVSSLLRWANVDGRWLELEITESVLATDLDMAVQKLAQLRELNVTTAVDDFGTGFSNLASLKLYPVDLLKIDRSFVQGLPDQENDIAIVKAIINMAKAMGLRLLAEGVETEPQRDLLRSYECDYVQGFLFARPMPLADFESEYLNMGQAGIIDRSH